MHGASFLSFKMENMASSAALNFCDISFLSFLGLGAFFDYQIQKISFHFCRINWSAISEGTRILILAR